MFYSQLILIMSNSDDQTIHKNIHIYTDIYFSIYTISDFCYVIFIHRQGIHLGFGKMAYGSCRFTSYQVKNSAEIELLFLDHFSTNLWTDQIHVSITQKST